MDDDYSGLIGILIVIGVIIFIVYVITLIAAAIAAVAAAGGTVWGGGWAILNYGKSMKKNLIDSNRVAATV